MFSKRKRNSIICFAAAAALTSSSQAWLTAAFVNSQSHGRSLTIDSPARCSTERSEIYPAIHRNADATLVLYSSQNNKERKKGFLEKAGDAVKSILPKGWFRSNEEKKKLAQRKEIDSQISGGLDEMLRNAPLGFQMMGKVLSPLMSTAASSLAETMTEQQRSAEALLEDARGYLAEDPAVVRILGEPIRLETPFSQSSSTTNTNGKTQSRVELAVEVTGSKGSGIARLLATNGGITQLQTEVGGRVINVSFSKQQPSSSGGSYSSSADDNGIIEAEIVDKETD